MEIQYPLPQREVNGKAKDKALKNFCYHLSPQIFLNISNDMFTTF